jgi:hypothetical protein
MRRIGWLFAFVLASAVVAAVVSLFAPATRTVPRDAPFVLVPPPPGPPPTPAAPGPVRPAPPRRRPLVRPVQHPRAPVTAPAAPEIASAGRPPSSGLDVASSVADAAAADPPVHSSFLVSFTVAPMSHGAPPRALRLRSSRPPLLVPMYASFATLQTLDYHSTRRALGSGAGREVNPLARSIVKHRPAFIAAKAAATAGMVLAAEKMWKTHPVRAIVFMGVANVAMAAVVAHNYSVK